MIGGKQILEREVCERLPLHYELGFNRVLAHQVLSIVAQGGGGEGVKEGGVEKKCACSAPAGTHHVLDESQLKRAMEVVLTNKLFPGYTDRLRRLHNHQTRHVWRCGGWCKN